MGLAPGAKVELICPPDYGYGEQGRDNVPPNTTLLFSLEVIKISQLDPKKLEPQASISKIEFDVKVTKEGRGPKAQKGDRVYTHYIGTLGNGKEV